MQGRKRYRGAARRLRGLRLMGEFKKNNPGCICCGGGGDPTCPCCLGPLPSSVTVTFASIGNSTCTCTGLNGSYVLSAGGHYSGACQWETPLPLPTWKCTPPSGTDYTVYVLAQTLTLASGNCGWRVRITYDGGYGTEHAYYEWDSGGTGRFDGTTQRTATLVSTTASSPATCTHASATCTIN